MTDKKIARPGGSCTEANRIVHEPRRRDGSVPRVNEQLDRLIGPALHGGRAVA